MGKLTSSRTRNRPVDRTSKIGDVPTARVLRSGPFGAVAALFCLAGVLGTPLAEAQPATKAKSSPTPVKTNPAAAPAEVEKPAFPPSRLVVTDDIKTYIEALSSQFLIRSRATDPFGQIQDPNAPPPIKLPVEGAVKRAAPTLITPFPELIRRISITTVMPGEKRFLVGTRSIKQGDQIPLTFRGRPIRVQVTEVTSQQISFRNMDSGEVALRKLDMLPPGMTAGKNGITAPGMVQDRPNSPIELEPGTSK